VLPVNWWNGEMGSTPGIATIIKEEERYSFFYRRFSLTSQIIIIKYAVD
jgi:hypothetical protein